MWCWHAKQTPRGGPMNLQAVGGVVLIVGLLILTAGILSPTEITRTAVSCVDDPYGWGPTCVEGTVTEPNQSRGSNILFGIIVTIGGFLMVLVSPGKN